jgi:polyphosphate kinase
MSTTQRPPRELRSEPVSFVAADPPAPSYFNRELSALDWQARVLEQARDARVPPLERLRFIAIVAGNLDEFFMVRVAGLMEKVDAAYDRPGELPVREQLDRISERVEELVRRQRDILHGDVLPILAEHGICIVPLTSLADEERHTLDDAYHRVVFPVLTPLAVGPGRPFPYISNLSLSLGVHVCDPASGARRFARVKVPEVLPRFWEVEGGRFVALEEMIAAHLGSLFPGMVIEEHAAFRVTRDADLEIEDDADDLLRAVENELRRRRFGDVVRLELSSSMSTEMREQLVMSLGVDRRMVYASGDLVDLADLAQLAGIDRPGLRYAPWSGVTPPRLRSVAEGAHDIFAAMREGDIFVHHPFDSFSSSVERLIQDAVDDPDVLAIKHTIYRTSGESPIVPGLIRAAEQGKQAVALVELKARFDEESNIGWARALERAGVHVVYGFADMKTHAKLALIVRREGEGIRRYAHIGTGNYNPKTARLYTDFGLLTCRPDITADVANLFNYLTGYAHMRSYRKLLVAPLDLRDRIVGEIEGLAASHSVEHPASIQMKMNNLVDKQVISALYRASQAGVPIDLVVRSICCLRPGVPGLSETIRVHSVLGRFLEHSRIYVFRDSDGARYYLGSADLMPRNLDNRVEVITPIEDEGLQRDCDEVLEATLADNRSAWRLLPGSEWERLHPGEGEPERSAQEELMRHALERASRDERPDEVDGDVAAERIVRSLPRRPGATE